MITANVIHRVFRIAGEKLAGTAFAIDIEDRQYLVTARHVVEGLSGACTISLFQDRDFSTFPVTVIGHAPGDIDVSVLAPSRKLTPDTPLPLPASADGLIYGQDAYFLGFPYDILPKFIFGPEGFPLPLVKRATVSAFNPDWFLLDGHNNLGFSGGPVVFKPPNSPNFRVAAVISGFERIDQPIFKGKGKEKEETDYTYRYNTGIIVAYDIKVATTIIQGNPSGLQLS